MKIYTSFYGNVKKIDKNQFSLVRVSNTAPSAFSNLPILSSVIPDWKTIVEPYKSDAIDKEEYNIRYSSQLSKLNKDKVLDYLEKLSRGKSIVLLCYEDSKSFCHRHMLCEWLNGEGEL